MAFLADTVWEVRTAGNDTNGGAFTTSASGTDFSQQNAKNTVGSNISTTDVVGNGTTTITSATAAFTAAIVGNIIYLQGGSGSLVATRRRVVSITNGTTIVVDASVASGTGITMNIGGALASLGAVGFNTVTNGNIIWIKAGTYSITSATPNISGGTFSKPTQRLYIEGYNATRGDLGTPPLLQASGISTFVMLTSNGLTYVANINFDGASLTSSRGTAVTGIVYKCNAVNFTNIAFFQVNDTTYIQCSASGCTGTAFSNGSFYGCIAHTNAGTGFLTSGSPSSIANCISYGNSGVSGFGFSSSNGSGQVYQNCVAYNNSKDGFRITTAGGAILINCIAEDNTENGFSIVNIMCELFNCAAFSNAVADFSLGTDIFVNNYNSIIGSGSFFTNAASGDFSLNNTAGAGAAVRAVGRPGIFPGGLTTSYLDIGAAQHQDTGGGGGSTEHSTVF